MKYPKAVMRLSELVEMGWTKQELLFIYRTTKTIAWKGKSRNSPIQFDTEELEKYRKAQCTGGRR